MNRAALVLGSLAIAALPASAHSFSRGQSRFAVDEHGAVDILIELSEEDTLDVFDVDLSDEAEAPRLPPILAEMLPKLLKLRGDGRLCPLTTRGFTRRGLRTIQLRATAQCSSLPGELLLDWGFGSHASLELVSYAQVTAPDKIEHVAVLSKKENRHAFRVARPSLQGVLQRRMPRGLLAGMPGALVLLAAFLLAAPGRRVLMAGAFGLGATAAGLGAVFLGEEAHVDRWEPLGPILVGLAGIGLAAAPVLLAARPAQLRALKPVLVMLGGLGTGLAVLVVAELGFDDPGRAVLSQAAGGLAPVLGVGMATSLFGRRLSGLGTEPRTLLGALAGGLGAAGAVVLLLFGG